MTQPTTERLALALEEAGAPASMVRKARAGHYDDYQSNLAMPIAQLVVDARRAGLSDIARRAADGDFDATKEESDAWAASPDGQEAFRQFFGGRGGG